MHSYYVICNIFTTSFDKRDLNRKHDYRTIQRRACIRYLYFFINLWIYIFILYDNFYMSRSSICLNLNHLEWKCVMRKENRVLQKFENVSMLMKSSQFSVRHLEVNSRQLTTVFRRGLISESLLLLF